MICDKPEKVLFNYLRDILYAPKKAHLEPEEFPEEFQELAQGIQVVGEFILENSRFMTALANGDLSCPVPGVENTIAASAKALHGSLAHLTWQTKQIAQGHFNQRVDFMGDFSQAFNHMVDQLKIAQDAEKKKLALEQQRVLELSQARELFMDMAISNRQLVILTDLQCGALLYCNQFLPEDQIAAMLDKMRAHPYKNQNEPVRWAFDIMLDGGRVFLYEVSSHMTIWDGQRAVAHMISDVTQLKEETVRMQQLAYRDGLTGLYNRRYGMDYMEQLVAQEKPFCVAFCDLDNLKYCNDAFGHEEGDRYILMATQEISAMPINKVVCRTGGDEFLIICEDVEVTALDAALTAAQCRIRSAPKPEKYQQQRNISFGIAEYAAAHGVNGTLCIADELMYKQKLHNKKQYSLGA